MALTSAQLVTLKAAIAAETNPTLVAARTAGATGAMADWYNLASTFVVWKTSVPVAQVGNAMDSVEVAGLTTANTNRLQVMAAYAGVAFNPSVANVRAGFDSVFSGAGGVNTRAALLALWKRFATNAEKLFATGNGADATPGALVFEGNVRNEDIVAALAS